MRDNCAAHRRRRRPRRSALERSVPATVNLPSLNSMSASEASSRCAAIFLPLAIDLVDRLDDRRCRRPRASASRRCPCRTGSWRCRRATISTLLDRDAEPVGDELGEGRLVALAVAVRAGEDGDAAGRMDPHLGRSRRARRARRARRRPPRARCRRPRYRWRCRCRAACRARAASRRRASKPA